MNPRSLIERSSLVKQWIAAAILSMIPILMSISYAAAVLKKQSNNQVELLKRVETVSNNSFAISDQIREMVRLSRQYALLLTPDFLKLYVQKSISVKENVDSLRSLLIDERTRKILNSIIETKEQIENELKRASSVRQEALSSELQLLVSLGAGISDEAERYRHNALITAEAEFNQAVSKLFFLIILSIPATLLLMIAAIFLVSRPLWRLSHAIHTLAQQNWQTPINIRGSKDLSILGQNLEWMRQQVVANDRQTTAFIQHVTHELKTPLSAIIEAGDLLYERIPGALTDKQNTILEVLRTNAKNLNNIIQQFLNYNTISSGFVTNWTEIDIFGLCDSIRLRLQTSNPRKSVNWEFHGCPGRVACDPSLLEMILKNVIENSFQIVPDGGNIGVRWRPFEHGWQISVSDDGPGIDPKQLENIYKPFYSGASDTRRVVPNTGIGLAIVLECIHLLKGRINVDSSPGQGATFVIFLPLSPGQE